MYQTVPTPDPGERPPATTKGAAAIGVTCLGLLISTFSAVMTFVWDPPGTADAAVDDGGRGFLLGYTAWGLASVLLLMLGAVLALRRRNGGRVLIWVIGGISVFTMLSCGGGGLIIEIAGSADGSRDTSFPPQWMIVLAVIGSFIGLIALIFAMVFFGRREVGNWIKPPPQFGYVQPPYPPQPPYGHY